jgi:hypothetical protein
MYRSVYLLLLFITTIHAQEDKTTAGAVLDEGKIIGGSDAPFGKYPWFAKARNGNGSWGGKFFARFLFYSIKTHLIVVLCTV